MALLEYRDGLVGPTIVHERLPGIIRGTYPSKEINALLDEQHAQILVEEAYGNAEGNTHEVKGMPMRFMAVIMRFSTHYANSHTDPGYTISQIRAASREVLSKWFLDAIKEYVEFRWFDSNDTIPNDAGNDGELSSHKCVCSHDITNTYYLYNVQNHNILMVGCVCVNKIDSAYIRKIHAIVKRFSVKCRGCNKEDLAVSMLATREPTGRVNAKGKAIKTIKTFCYECYWHHSTSPPKKACLHCCKFKVKMNTIFGLCKGCSVPPKGSKIVEHPDMNGRLVTVNIMPNGQQWEGQQQPTVGIPHLNPEDIICEITRRPGRVDAPPKGTCERCGRSNHYVYDCQAEYHIKGQRLLGKAPVDIPFNPNLAV